MNIVDTFGLLFCVFFNLKNQMFKTKSSYFIFMQKELME
jgi:hypothetical protein